MDPLPARVPSSPESAAGPVRTPDRIVALDVLRGAAVLGILVINIQSFAMVFAAYMNPTAHASLEGAHYWVWYFSHLLADQKFMTIFSMLFGAGILLMADRQEAVGRRAAGVHFRRMAALLVFGLLHAYLFWYGDILVLYAVCGSLAFLFRRKSPRSLIIIGMAVVAVSSLLSLAGGLSMSRMPELDRAALERDFAPPPDKVAEEVAHYRGGWLRQMEHRIPKALEFHTFIFLVWGVWRAGGLMLIGMGLFKLGVFSAARSRAFYASLTALGILVGLPVVMFGIRLNEQADWDVGYSFFFGVQFNYWASLLVSLAWVALVMLACRSPRLERLTQPLAAVGRMAFTNYILQTILCTTLFYGHGLGLFGSVERVGQMGIVLAVWVLQLVVSPLWLRHFRYGPLEWLWRTLTYWRPVPFRSPAAQGA